MTLKLRESDDLTRRLFSAVESVREDAVKELAIALASARTRVVSGLAFAAHDDGCTTTLYRLEHNGGAVLIDGVGAVFDANEDLVILGEDSIDAIDLEGAAAEALELATAVAVVIVCVLGAEGAVLVAVYGAAASSAPTAPTADQVRAALQLAGVDGWDRANGIIVARLSLERHKLLTVTVGAPSEGETHVVTVGGAAVTVTAGAEDDETDVATALQVAGEAAWAALPITVTVDGADVIVEADARSTFTHSTGGTGSLTAVVSDVVLPTLTNPATDADLLRERQAGSLYSFA